MTIVRLTGRAETQLEEIFGYTRARWGLAQVETYTRGIVDACNGLADRSTLSRQIPADWGVTGFVARYASHLIYWRRRDDGDIDISAILHERMHQPARLRAMGEGERN